MNKPKDARSKELDAIEGPIPLFPSMIVTSMLGTSAGLKPGQLTVICGRRSGKSSSVFQAFVERFRRCEHNEFLLECEEPECTVAKVMNS